MVSILVFNACLQCLVEYLVEYLFDSCFQYVVPVCSLGIELINISGVLFLLQAHQRVLNAELDMEGVNDDKSRVGSMCALCFLTIFDRDIFEPLLFVRFLVFV